MGTVPIQRQAGYWHWLKRHRRRLLLVSLGCCGALLIPLVQIFMADSPLADLAWQGWFAMAVTGAAFLLNALTFIPAEIVFLGALAMLYVSGVLPVETALAGFSNGGMVTVGVLYIVVTGLQQTGGLDRISQWLLGLPKGETAAMVRLITPVMGLSAFLNNTPVVAMFIPVVGDWCRKLKINPSKLMIPLSYASIFGGVCTLIGTSTNLVVNGLLIDATGSGMGLLDIAWVGVPCAIAAFLFLLLTQRWLLPNRKSAFNT
ncbi:SLC13 family permease, partial [filamentous cyanobacterium CCP5]